MPPQYVTEKQCITVKAAILLLYNVQCKLANYMIELTYKWGKGLGILHVVMLGQLFRIEK